VVWSRFPLPTSRPPLPDDVAIQGAPPPYPDAEMALIAAHVDAAYYRGQYPDIARSALDPVVHFHQHGWREGRNPSSSFDTNYYLTTYPDISRANINPLLHYIRDGRAEGRMPMRPGGARRAIIDRASPPAARPTGYDAPPNAAVLTARELGNLLHAVCAAAAGLVLSASHDRYIDVTGGVQLLVADEQGLFNGNRFAYLHIAPAIARMTLDPSTDGPAMLQLVLDGFFIGLAPYAGIVQALEELPPSLAPIRLFTVHSLFGHRVTGLVALAAALRAAHNFFWLHDYASLCEGYNLLRDDIAFCGAPPPDSMACRVCVYGESRPAYRAALRGLFDAVQFHVLAPSRAALDIWLRATDLPHLSARVHQNCLLEVGPVAAPDARPDLPVRVAFVGYPMPHKGWPAFLALMRQMRDAPEYRFYHFSSATTQRSMDGLVCVPVRVDRYERHAMAAALAEHGIDLVLVLSPWPETFSYVTYEALAAGADVIALASSGNVADAVRRNGRGVVLRDEDALLAFFGDRLAVAYAQARHAAGPRPGVLRLIGSTATVDLAAGDGPDPARLATTDPDLRVVAAGREILPQRDGDRYRFDLPDYAGIIRLVSRSVVPAAVLMGATDHRRLGVAISRMTLDGAIVPPSDARRLLGWHGTSARVQWTSGDATLDAGDAKVLEIELERLVTYIASPLAVPFAEAGV
jgi:glycosyltransferase involved in cell wall biosynthesis